MTYNSFPWRRATAVPAARLVLLRPASRAASLSRLGRAGLLSPRASCLPLRTRTPPQHFGRSLASMPKACCGTRPSACRRCFEIALALHAMRRTFARSRVIFEAGRGQQHSRPRGRRRAAARWLAPLGLQSLSRSQWPSWAIPPHRRDRRPPRGQRRTTAFGSKGPERKREDQKEGSSPVFSNRA